MFSLLSPAIMKNGILPTFQQPFTIRVNGKHYTQYVHTNLTIMLEVYYHTKPGTLVGRNSAPYLQNRTLPLYATTLVRDGIMSPDVAWWQRSMSSGAYHSLCALPDPNSSYQKFLNAPASTVLCTKRLESTLFHSLVISRTYCMPFANQAYQHDPQTL